MNTCMESALMTSPPYFSAISNASFDFPVPVAPHTTITGTRFKSLVALVNPAAAMLGTREKKQTRDNNRRTPGANPGAFSFSFLFFSSSISRSLTVFMGSSDESLGRAAKRRITTVGRRYETKTTFLSAAQRPSSRHY